MECIENIAQILILAFRNLFRNKRRTLLTTLSLAIGLWGVILIDGFVSYSMWGLGETVIHSGLGHLQIAGGERFFSEGTADPFSFLIPRTEKVIKKIRAFSEVKQVVPSVTFQALLQGRKGVENVLVVALPPEDAVKNLDFRSIEEGRDLRRGETRGIVLGKTLARKMNVKVGDSLYLLSAMQGGGVNMIDVEVVGISVSGIATYDAVISYLSLNDAKELLLLEDLPQLLIFLENTRDTDNVADLISKSILPELGPGLSLRKWHELSDYYKEARGSYDIILYVAKAIISLVAVFVILNTLSMAMFERIGEIGTLRALGTAKPRLLGLFMTEGLFLGILGTGVGIAAGLATCVLLNLSGGVSFPAQPGMSVSLTIFFKPDILGVAGLPLISVPAALTGTLFPALRAIHLNIADSLRSNL